MQILWIVVSSFFMFLSLWVAFSPKFRPISWSTFYLNLGAAGINLASIIANGWALLSR